MYRRVGIWGHYHGGNQGDDLVVNTLISHIRAHCPGVEIQGFSHDPADTERRHGIPAVALERKGRPGLERPALPGSPASGPGAKESTRRRLRDRLKARAPWLRAIWRRLRLAWRHFGWFLGEPYFLWKNYPLVKSMDLIVVAGSGPLFDGWNRGPWDHPYRIFKWSLLARLAGTKFVFLCTGAGPIEYRLTRFFLGKSLRWAHYRSYRDRGSAELIRGLGIPGEHPVFPDLAFSFDMDAFVGALAAAEPVTDRKVVGLNPIPFYDGRYWPRSDPGKYTEYLDKMKRFARWLLESGYAIRLFYSQLKADKRVNDDLRAALEADGDLDLDANVFEERIDGFEDLIDQIRQCDFVVAGRFHGIVIPYMLRIPTIGLAYHFKTHDLLDYIGQPGYSIDIGTFRVDELVSRFESLVANADAIREETARRLPALRDKLEAQYNRVLGPVPGSEAAGEDRAAMADGHAARSARYGVEAGDG